MMIVIDPSELVAASDTLRSCAIESADIGTQLWSCAQCAMPGDIQGVVDQLVAAADRVLDEIGSQLSLRATDLANRAQIAANDSLVAANEAQALTGLLPSTVVNGVFGSAVTVLTPAGSPAESIFGGTMTIAGANPDVVSLAGSPFTTMTIGGNPLTGLFDSWTLDSATIGGNDVSGLTAGWTLDSATIGGNDVSGLTAGWTLDSATIGGNDLSRLTDGWIPAMTTFSLGAPDRSQGTLSGVFALAQLQDNLNRDITNRVSAIAADPNSSPYALRVGFRALDAVAYTGQHTLAPSLQEVYDRNGGWIPDSEVRLNYPGTLDYPITNILIP